MSLSASTDKLTHLKQANIAQANIAELVGFQTTSSALTYMCIKSAANFQDLSKSPYLSNSSKPKLTLNCPPL